MGEEFWRGNAGSLGEVHAEDASELTNAGPSQLCSCSSDKITSDPDAEISSFVILRALVCLLLELWKASVIIIKANSLRSRLNPERSPRVTGHVILNVLYLARLPVMWIPTIER